MTWKKSEDGGLDYDVSQEAIKKEESFNPFATAYTTTFNFNLEELPAPKSRKEEIQERIRAFRNVKKPKFI